MVIKEIAGHITDIPLHELKHLHVEKVYVENEALAKRLHSLISDHHNEINVHLPQGQHLHVGDILIKNGNNIVVVDVLGEDILVISPKNIREMGEVAHSLGNRHLPAQFTDEEMLVQYDYLVEQLLHEQKISFLRESRQLQVPFRHIGHNHNE